MKTYTSYTIDSTSEGLIGLLSLYPFESFEEHEGYMVAYIPEDECTDDVKADIDKTIKQFAAAYRVETIQPQNWNAIWESSFEPVVVDDFCMVRADFHEANDSIEHDIIINPKMAFGTGHHETTYMMMSSMRDLDIKNKTVFDYGCGTGVLAILASKLESDDIDAIDIEEESFENTKENATINKISNIHVSCATLESFPAKTYDLILANINRNVLLASAEELYSRLNSGGHILLSGILEEDETLVTDCYKTADFIVLNIQSKGYWKCILLSK